MHNLRTYISAFMKRLEFIGSSQDDLRNFPAEAAGQPDSNLALFSKD
jgi:phage-related protein